MLLSLSLHHFVIVDELHLSFDDGLTVLTGETGAGKSIILDALGLLLGDKADFSQVRQGEKEARLSALFNLSKLPELRKQLCEQGFLSDEEDEIVVRRIIDSKGKSRNFINGQSATLTQLKSMGELLIDIHGQSAHHSLNHENTQRTILDAFSGSLKQVEQVQAAYRDWQNAQTALANAQENTQARQAEYERLLWQKDELEKLNPSTDEWSNLTQSYDTLAHAADLLQASNQADDLLNGDKGIQSALAQCQKLLTQLSNIEPRFNECIDLLQSAEAELSEVSVHLREVSARTEIDPQALAQQELRMAQLSAIAKKYRINPEELPEKYLEISENLAQLQAAEDIDTLQTACDTTWATYQTHAQKLSAQRRQGADKLSQEVSAIMHTLSMEGAIFQVALSDCPASAYGCERICYQVALNSGSVLRPLAKVASGGELARISLALQVAASRHTTVPTLIFDEVDSGIGGRVADVVGQRLAQLADNYQVLLITHLAQVAAHASQHWRVHKQNHNGHTLSTIEILDEHQRIEEIARMIGGSHISETTLRHAQEMITLAKKT